MNFPYKTPKGPNVTFFTIAHRPWQNTFDYNGGSETQISSRKNAYNSVVCERNFILFHSWTPWVVLLMNSMSGIFTRGYATRKRNAFGVHSVK